MATPHIRDASTREHFIEHGFVLLSVLYMNWIQMNVRQRLDQLVAKKARVDGLVKDGLLTSNQKDRLRNASRLYGAGIWLMRKKLGRLKALRRKKDNIPSPEELKKIWADSSVFGDKVALKKQLSHAQMIALADRLGSEPNLTY